MGLPRLSSVLVGLLALSIALGACTGDDAPTADADGSPRTSPPPVTSAESYVFTDAAGIEARLTLEDEGATLTVDNETGGSLPRPGVYVLDARSGARIDWTVVDAGVARGGQSEWQVQRPPVPEAKHIGLVVLEFGGEDYGAFVPPEPGQSA